MDCPESLEEYEELERKLNLCPKTMYLQAIARVESGAAKSRHEAEKQLSEETSKPLGTVRDSVRRGKNEVDGIRQDESITTESSSIKKCPSCHNLYDSDKWDFSISGRCPYCFNRVRQNAFISRKPLVSKFTGDNESYTPSKYIEAARGVMGSIDLDPASNEKAQKVVRANRFFTVDMDGLEQDWYGNIFLNPPYSQPEIKCFINKLLVSPYKQAILLTNNNTDTTWFHNAAKECAAFCLTRGRINFYKSDDSTTSPVNGQTFFYYGNSKQRFAEIFSEFGFIGVQYER